MSNPIVKTYFSYHEMVKDFSELASDLDFEKTLTTAPPMSFYTKDGRIALGGNFIHFLSRLREETGLKVNPFGSEEQRGFFLVSFEDYAPVEQNKEAEVLEVKAVDTPAKKRSQRATSTKK